MDGIPSKHRYATKLALVVASAPRSLTPADAPVRLASVWAIWRTIRLVVTRPFVRIILPTARYVDVWTSGLGQAAREGVAPMSQLVLPTLDDVHLELFELMKLPPVNDEFPAYLFRGERSDYPDTFTSMDRHFHQNPIESVTYDELDRLTNFVMKSMFPSGPLSPRHAAAFAQHYGLPTQMFDFNSSANVAAFFAANRAIHKEKPKIGKMGILNVEKALDSKKCDLYDLQTIPEALRARRQHGFGMIYTGFRPDDRYSLKDEDLATEIGLEWKTFAHLPDDETFLYLIGADEDILSVDGDPFAGLAQEFVDQYVSLNGPLRNGTEITSRFHAGSGTAR